MNSFLRTGNYGNVKGSARFASNDGRAELIVGFEGIPCEYKSSSGICRHQCLLSVGNGDGGTNPNYLVVATDYTSYAIVYSCAEKLFLGKKGEVLSFKLYNLFSNILLFRISLAFDKRPESLQIPRGWS